MLQFTFSVQERSTPILLEKLLVGEILDIGLDHEVAGRRQRHQEAGGRDASEEPAVKSAAADLLAKLSAWEEQVPQPPLPDGLEDRIAYPSHLLSTQVLHVLSIVDQGPPISETVEQRVAALQSTWAGLADAQRQLIETGLADFNRLVDEANRVEVPQGLEPAPRPY